MKNYIKMLSEKFAKQIAEYGITEVNVINGEFYSTSNFDFDQSLEDAMMQFIKEAFRKEMLLAAKIATA